MPRQNNGPRLEINEFGIYEIRWWDTEAIARGRRGRTKRVSTRTASLQEAQRFLAGWILEAERAQAGAWDINQVLDFYDSARLSADKTAQPDNERQRMKSLRPHFGDMIYSEISIEDVNEYVRKRRTGKIAVETRRKVKGGGWVAVTEKRKVSDSTIRRELVVLIAAMNFCGKHKKIDKRAIPAIELPPEGAPKDHWLTTEELNILFDLAQPKTASRLTRIYRFVNLAYWAPARRRAIQSLDWFRTNLDRGVVDYRRPGDRVTKKRKVAVGMADELKAVLQRAYNEKISEFVLDDDGEIRTAFETLIRNAAAHAQALARAALDERDMAAANHYNNMAIRFRKVTPHTLRHTRGTHMAQAGVDLWGIAGVLGDTIATVEKHYAHHSPNYQRKAVNARPDDHRQKEEAAR